MTGHRRRRPLTPGLVFAVALVACGPNAPEPAALDAQEACAACRMAVSDPRLAAQVVAPDELPLFFDDLGCLAGFVKAGRMPTGAVAFVADHRTKAWVRADRAVYTRVPGLSTPMASQLVAHETSASRDGDAAAAGGTAVLAAEIFGEAAPLGGSAAAKARASATSEAQP